MKDVVGIPAVKQAVARPFEIFLVLLMILLGVGQFTNFRQNSSIRDTQDAGVIRGYINRAITCDLAKGIGSAEPDGCSDPVITPYRDKDLVAGSTAGARASAKTQELICSLLVASPDPQVQQVRKRLC